VALLHYSPIAGTVEGEPREIYAYLGSSRLEEPLIRYPVDVVFHGHAHHGTAEGKTVGGVTVYNVSLALLLRTFPDAPPFRVVELRLAHEQRDGRQMERRVDPHTDRRAEPRPGRRAEAEPSRVEAEPTRVEGEPPRSVILSEAKEP
jgi:hypothetical protein